MKDGPVASTFLSSSVANSSGEPFQGETRVSEAYIYVRDAEKRIRGDQTKLETAICDLKLDLKADLVEKMGTMNSKIDHTKTDLVEKMGAMNSKIDHMKADLLNFGKFAFFALLFVTLSTQPDLREMIINFLNSSSSRASTFRTAE